MTVCGFKQVYVPYSVLDRSSDFLDSRCQATSRDTVSVLGTIKKQTNKKNPFKCVLELLVLSLDKTSVAVWAY